MNLRRLVDTYQRNNKYDWILSECKPGKKPVDEVIEYAVYTWTPELKVAHRSYSGDNKARKELISKLRKSKGSLGTPTTFEEIMKWVYNQRVYGISSLGVYDTALRMGVYFGIYPTKVYIHSGSAEGTMMLLGKSYKEAVDYFFMDDNNYPVLDPSKYPKEISILEPYHIENFLCEKKDQIKE
jgi:hypothetical protein